MGKFCSALDWKMSVYFMAIWNILRAFWIFFDDLVNIVFIWYIFPVLCHVPRRIWQPCFTHDCILLRIFHLPPLLLAPSRVARWYIFIPKKYNLGKFLRSLKWKIFYGHSEHITDISISLAICQFSKYLLHFFLVLVLLC
jgi:hypothetical protein